MFVQRTAALLSLATLGSAVHVQDKQPHLVKHTQQLAQVRQPHMVRHAKQLSQVASKSKAQDLEEEIEEGLIEEPEHVTAEDYPFFYDVIEQVAGDAEADYTYDYDSYLGANGMGQLEPEDKFPILISTGECLYCAMAQQLLKSMCQPIFDLNLDEFDNAEEASKDLNDATGNTYVPKIYIGSKYIGGYTQLKQAILAGELDESYLDQIQPGVDFTCMTGEEAVAAEDEETGESTDPLPTPPPTAAEIEEGNLEPPADLPAGPEIIDDEGTISYGDCGLTAGKCYALYSYGDSSYWLASDKSSDAGQLPMSLVTSETALADELPMLKSESIFKIEEGLDGDVDAFTMVDTNDLVIKTTMNKGQNSNVLMRTIDSATDATYFPGKASWKCVGNLADDGYIFLRNMNVGGSILTTENVQDVFPYLGTDGLDTKMVCEAHLEPEESGWVPQEMECQ